MAVTSYFFNKFIEHVGKGDIDLDGDTFKVILVNGYTYDATDDLKADIGAVEIANGNGYTTGGATITGVTWGFASTVTKFDGDNITWTATGGALGPATGAIIYDDTSTGDMLVGYIDFGTALTAGEDTDFRITFNASGIFTIAS